MADNSITLGGLSTILFVGNSYTFGRVDPAMHYNAANVHDLTAASNGGTFTNTTGSNPYEPIHGVASRTSSRCLRPKAG